MKDISIIIIILILIAGCCSKAVKNVELNLSNKLIGVWYYVETRDDNNFKIKSYQEKFGKVIASGPQINLNSNGTYEKIFSPQNTDSGYWYVNINKMQVEYDLYIDSTDFVGADLIGKGLAVKHEDGRYYERIVDKIIEVKDTSLVLGNRGKQIIYRKRE